ncbi:MAG TPA: sigma-54 dependent transcriptional regulator [Anaeromyxobacteraceae bacterium]|nr:sigma-54 dependent transcriptional regulator [Anaeromyxobacteraceae bacterium]
MARTATVLVVDDDPSIRQTMEAIVRSAGMIPLTAPTGEDALQLLRKSPVDVMLLDVQLPGMSGLDVLRLIREGHPDVGVIMVSVVKEIPIAVEAIKLGALDYLTKDFSPGELSARVSKSLEQLRAARELAWLREEVAVRGNKPMVAGRSAAMASVVAIADKVAAKPVTVLINGESGTGKEVLARWIHQRSDRSHGPFVAVNLPAIPSELVESTLFGHEKGSFTGATRQRYGKFELANGGTLFLDEIAELKLEVQSKLLRALQEREVERVGGARPINVDLRVICATNRPLDRMVAEGRFREDLYWRLKVVPIEVPPLRERREDVRDLAQHFLSRFAAAYGRVPQTLTPEAVALLENYAWPGNVRELENLVERLTVVCDAPVIDETELPLEIAVGAGLAREAERESSYESAMAAFEKGYLRKILGQVGWNRRRAAEKLGIGYSTLKAKLRDHGLTRGEGPADGDED